MEQGCPFEERRAYSSPHVQGHSHGAIWTWLSVTYGVMGGQFASRILLGSSQAYALGLEDNLAAYLPGNFIVGINVHSTTTTALVDVT